MSDDERRQEKGIGKGKGRVRCVYILDSPFSLSSQSLTQGSVDDFKGPFGDRLRVDCKQT